MFALCMVSYTFLQRTSTYLDTRSMPEIHNRAIDLRSLRLERGLIQDALGSRTEVIACERGRRLPGPRLLTRMAIALRLDEPVVFKACQEAGRRAALGEPLGPSLTDGPSTSGMTVGETLTPARTTVVFAGAPVHTGEPSTSSPTQHSSSSSTTRRAG